MSKHILLAGSDTPPLNLEFDERGEFRTTEGPAHIHGSGGYDLCGCCGARYADTVEKFNTTFAGKDMYVYQNQRNTYNRGVLAGINMPINDVKEVPGTVVEHIQCGEDVLSLRLRMEQVYGD